LIGHEYAGKEKEGGSFRGEEVTEKQPTEKRRGATLSVREE